MAVISCVAEDILINNVPLNAVDADGNRWMVTELDGWWGPPPSIIPEDERPYDEDGNYLTAGRFGPRTIQINGVIVPPGGSSDAARMAVVKARNRLINTLDMIRKTGVFTVLESGGAKQAEVQTFGRPLLNIETQNNVLHYDIQLIASDPRKYSVNVKTGTSDGRSNYQPITAAGRRYDRTYNLFYTHTNHAAQIFVVNEGDHPTWGTLRVSGPVTNPKVTHEESGKFLEIEIALSESEFVDIDLKKRTIMLNGTESVLPKLNFNSSWFDYAPGVNTLFFTGIEITPGQEGWREATNLATNPSMETAGETITIRRNAASDPSFEARDGQFAQTRVNYAKSSGWVVDQPIPGYPSNATTEVIATDDWSVSVTPGDYYSMELRAITENNDTYADITPAGLSFVAGEYFTISATMQLPQSLHGVLSPYAATIAVRYLDTVTQKTKVVHTKSTPDVAGVRRETLIFRVPENATDIQFLLYNGSGLVWGETNREVLDWVTTVVRWDDILITSGPDSGEYFDTTTPSQALVEYTTVNGNAVERRLTSPRWQISGQNTAWLVDTGTASNSDTDLRVKFVRTAELSTVATSDVLNLNPEYPAVTVGATFNATSIPITVTPILIDLEAIDYEGQDAVPYAFGAARIITPKEGAVQVRSPILKPSDNFRVGFLLQETVNTQLNMAGKRSDDPTVDNYQAKVVAFVDVDSVLIVDGTYRGSYFDGNTPSPDMLVSWESGIEYGTSIAESPRVAGVSNGPEALTYRSKMWFSHGTSSLAVITSDKVVNLNGDAYAVLTAPAWDDLPNGTYTVIAYCKAEDGQYLETPNTRTITAYDAVSNLSYVSAQAPTGSATRLTVRFDKTGPGGEIRLVANALGNEVVRWDGILVVEGDYSDRYFDGDTEEAVWDGAEHASTSSQEFKVSVPSSTLFTEHRNAWIN